MEVDNTMPGGTELSPVLRISWKRGPNLPQGFQDSDAGFIGTELITVGGFGGGRDDNLKPGRYPRGFLNKTWAFDVAAPEAGWAELPDCPATPRQGMMAAVVGGALYCWGGFNYTPPGTWADGYRLRHENGVWKWDELPPLPWPLTMGGICVIGKTIYLFGGGDYDCEKDFRTDADRRGGTPRLGARLLVFDAANPGAGWKSLAECPGTPRMGMASAVVGGKIYVVGGAAASPKLQGYFNVVDNWRYDPVAASWESLGDMPMSSSLFPDNQIVFQERYLILVGGFQYAGVLAPDGTTRPPYGEAHMFEGKGEYYNDVFVYDTKTGTFGTADSLPINNALPTTIVRGDEIYLIGGETGGGMIEGEYYGHHPDLFLRGKIEVI